MVMYFMLLTDGLSMSLIEKYTIFPDP